jgi:hypothetical protein
MRFTTGKWNDNGIPRYSWTVIFDDQADKLKYANELRECVEIYREILKKETWNLLALKAENGALVAAMNELVKLFRQMIIIKNLVAATISPGLEFDYVFIAERDQGVGQFVNHGSSCSDYITAARDLTEAINGVIRTWTEQNTKSGSPGSPAPLSTS